VNSKNYSFTNKIFTTIKIVLGFVGPKAGTTKPKAYGRMSWTICLLPMSPSELGNPPLIKNREKLELTRGVAALWRLLGQ